MTDYHARLVAVAIATVAFSTPITAQQQPTPQEIADIRVRAEQGDADAQFNLGQILAVDFGRDRSGRQSGRRQEALLWLSRSAEQGHAQAYREFLLIHARGLGGRTGDYSATLTSATRYKSGELSFVDLQEQVLTRALPPHSSGDRHCTAVPAPPPNCRGRGCAPPTPPIPGSPPDTVDYSHWNLRMPLGWEGTWCEVAMVWTEFKLLTTEEYTKLHCAAHPMHCTPVEDARAREPTGDIGTTVTIETRDGDLIDGDLVSANESAVVIRVAGQPLTVPVEVLRYISFDGRIGASGDGGKELALRAEELRAAIGALRTLKAQVEALDREDQVIFVAYFNAALPAITTFLSSVGDNWADVNHAIRMAVRYYRASPNDDGTLDTSDLTWARAYVDYADKLSGDPNEKGHREDVGEPGVLVLNQPVEARLGAGDREMARDLDGSSAGAYNDVYQFTLTEPMRTDIVLRCDPCRPHLTLIGTDGETLEGDAGRFSGRSRIRRDLEAGTYYIWAGATSRGDVGEYTLTVGPRE